ncbi:MAG: SPOR domain-containing protein [Pseudomonadota bacterium]
MHDPMPVDYGLSGHPDGPGGFLGTLLRWGGGLVSLALIAALIVWAYRLGERDAQAVPVIQAMAGAARIAPEDPEGTEMAHQGLAVNEVVEARRVAEPETEVALAAPPEDLAEEDLPAAALAAPPVPEPVPETEAETEAAIAAAVTEAVTEAATAAETALAAPLAGSGATPASLTPYPPVEESSRLALAYAFAPPRRPATLNTARPPTTAEVRAAAGRPTAADPDAELRPEDVAPGTDLIQLGAYDSPEIARAEWRRISGAHTDLLGERRLLIEQTTSGGRVFFRLRAVGFDTRAAAEAACTALGNRGQPCNPVKAS